MTEGAKRLNLLVPKDYPPSATAALHRRLKEHLQVDEPGTVFRRTFEPSSLPEVIQLIGDYALWIVLAPPATAFLTRIASRAADNIWDAATEALRRPDIKPLADVSGALADAISKLGQDAELIIGIDVPDRNWGTAVVLKEREPEKIARSLALFVTHAERLSVIMQIEIENGRRPLGRASITIEGKELVVRWNDRNFESFERRID